VQVIAALFAAMFCTRDFPGTMMPKTDNEILCGLLDEAVEVLQKIPDGGLTSYDSGKQMAEFIASCRDAIAKGTIDCDHRRKLWDLFAPTCEWDDIGGGVILGNVIFELIDAMYGHEIHNSPR